MHGGLGSLQTGHFTGPISTDLARRVSVEKVTGTSLLPIVTASIIEKV